MATSLVTIGEACSTEGELLVRSEGVPAGSVLVIPPLSGNRVLSAAKPGAGIPTAVAEVFRSMLAA